MEERFQADGAARRPYQIFAFISPCPHRYAKHCGRGVIAGEILLIARPERRAKTTRSYG